MTVQFLEQHFRRVAFARTVGGDGPLRAFEIIDGDEGRLATHGQAHVLGDEIGVDLVADRGDGLPLCFAVRFGDARVFVHTHHGVAVFEIHFAYRGHALNGGGMTEMRGRGERNMPFGGEQA